MKLQSRNASASIMNFFPSCCCRRTSFFSSWVLHRHQITFFLSPSHVCRQLAILVADFFSSHVLYFARAESSISTKWSANCKETKGLWGSPAGFSGCVICLIWRPEFGIQNQNDRKKREKYTREMRDTENNHRDYGITRNLVRGLWDWRTRLGASNIKCINENIIY